MGERHVAWEWLDRLARPVPGAMAAARLHLWQEFLRHGALPEACRQQLDGEAAELDNAWEAARSEELIELVRYSFTPDGPPPPSEPSDRLLGNVRGWVAAAQAVRAARRYDLAGLARWTHEAAAAWGGSRTESALTESVPWQRGLEPHTVLDEHFVALARLAPGRWRVGAARDCARSLLGLGLRPAVRSRALWLMGYKQPRGFLLRLHVELLEDGFGEFYADPSTLGLVPFTDAFLRAVKTAWLLAGGQPGQRPRPGQGTQPAETLAAALGSRDVRWRLEGADLGTLEGGSLGLGLAVALVALLRDEPLDPRCAVTGAVDGQGNVIGVSHVIGKVAAAWQQ